MADDCTERLQSDSKYFSSMVNLIPAKYYFTKEDDPSSEPSGGKYRKRKKDNATMKMIKQAKKKKLDPTSHKTIEEIQKEKEMKEKAEMEESEQGGQLFSLSDVPSTSLGNLKQRLHDKMEMLRSKRGGKRPAQENGEISKSKKKKKEKKSVTLKKESVQKGKSPTKPSIVTESGKVVYSKFDFINPSEPSTFERKKKGKEKSDLHTLLAKAEKQQKKLEILKQTDEEKGKELEANINWKRALKKAKGEKLKDNPEQLKRTIKRKQKKKEQSKKKWNAKTDQVKMNMQKRQQSRQRHIQAKIDNKKARKMKKRKPGF